jgi:hypothetical protein
MKVLAGDLRAHRKQGPDKERVQELETMRSLERSDEHVACECWVERSLRN